MSEITAETLLKAKEALDNLPIPAGPRCILFTEREAFRCGWRKEDFDAEGKREVGGNILLVPEWADQ